MNHYIIHWKAGIEQWSFELRGDRLALKTYIDSIRKSYQNAELLAVEEVVLLRMRIDVDGEIY